MYAPRTATLVRSRLPWLLGQAGLIALGLVAYFGIRGLTQGSPGLAVRHAHHVVTFERTLGIYAEPTVQSWIAPHDLLADIANWIYVWGHWPVIIAAMIWLGWQHREVFLRLRDGMLISGALGMVVFLELSGRTTTTGRAGHGGHRHRALPLLLRVPVAHVRQPVRRRAEPARRLGPARRHRHLHRGHLRAAEGGGRRDAGADDLLGGRRPPTTTSSTWWSGSPSCCSPMRWRWSSNGDGVSVAGPTRELLSDGARHRPPSGQLPRRAAGRPRPRCRRHRVRRPPPSRPPGGAPPEDGRAAPVPRGTGGSWRRRTHPASAWTSCSEADEHAATFMLDVKGAQASTARALRSGPPGARDRPSAARLRAVVALGRDAWRSSRSCVRCSRRATASSWPGCDGEWTVAQRCTGCRSTCPCSTPTIVAELHRHVEVVMTWPVNDLAFAGRHAPDRGHRHHQRRAGRPGRARPASREGRG